MSNSFPFFLSVCFMGSFLGRGIVTQEFCKLGWEAASVDLDKNSNATIQKDIMKLKPTDLGFVPDFIWVSPPCHTYSKLAGGKHRCLKTTGHLSKTKEALDHDNLFMKVTDILRWAKRKHKHLIVVIENPVGLLKSMPLFEAFSEEFKLQEVEVHYCAFGREEKKPTHLWTNDPLLAADLRGYTCNTGCSQNGKHPVQVRGNKKYDFACIPQPLAQEVACSVSSTFHRDKCHKRKAALADETSFDKPHFHYSRSNSKAAFI